jgi:hypothetical protein
VQSRLSFGNYVLKKPLTDTVVLLAKFVNLQLTNSQKQGRVIHPTTKPGRVLTTIIPMTPRL